MKNSQKGFIVPFVIVIIALFVIGGWIYFYQKNEKKTEVMSVASTDVIRGWLRGDTSQFTLQEVASDYNPNTDNDAYSGRNFRLIFNTNSKCYILSSFPSKNEVSCSHTDNAKWGTGDRVTVEGDLTGDILVVDYLEVMSGLPISLWISPDSFVAWAQDSIYVRSSAEVILTIDDFPDAIQVSKDASFGSSDRITDVEVSPDNKWLSIAVSGAAHDFGWLYDISAKKLTPVAFSYGGGVNVKKWKNNKEAVFEITTAKPNTFEKIINIDKLPIYPGI